MVKQGIILLFMKVLNVHEKFQFILNSSQIDFDLQGSADNTARLKQWTLKPCQDPWRPPQRSRAADEEDCWTAFTQI